MKCDRDLVDYLQASLTPMIAVAGIWISWLQWKLAKVRFNHEWKLSQDRFTHDRFERRFKMFEAIRDYISATLSGSPSNSQAVLRLYQGTDGARFVFDEAVAIFIKELVSLGTDLDNADIQLRDLQPGKDRSGLVAARRKIRDQLDAAGRELEGRFSKYLSI